MNIDIWFLVLGLILPRLTLFVAMMAHAIPLNGVPFFADFIMAIFIPNLLISIYCFEHDMVIWGIAHIFAFVVHSAIYTTDF